MQKQPDKKTVQGCIENALEKLNIKPEIKHAGRTDRGVHALNQVISFDIPDYWEIEKLKTSLNKILHPSIHIKKISLAENGFHPRHSAVMRSYRYVLSPDFSPFYAKYTAYYPNNINYEKTKKALKLFEGTHDFEYFAKTGSDVESYVRTIYKTDIFKYKNMSIIKIKGNGFLRAQIRLIVDFVLKVNEGILSTDDLKRQLEKKEIISKHLACPNGLYLERIWYAIK